MADMMNGCTDVDGNFKEAVCIDAGRVFDSCCDRDCLEDLRVCFTPETQAIINNAASVRLRSAKILNVCIDVEPVNFNRGFYACDMTFYFLLCFEICPCPGAALTEGQIKSAQEIKGVAQFSKKVILFGSEGNVKIFTNGNCACGEGEPEIKCNMPKCVVQAVDPVPLSARLGEVRDCYDNVCCLPESIKEILGGEVVTDQRIGDPTIYVTLGLFTIVQLIRNVQMLVPVYDYCIPEKQCDDTTDQPCDIFRRIKFPTNDFFPPRPCEVADDEYYGCCGNSDSQ